MVIALQMPLTIHPMICVQLKRTFCTPSWYRSGYCMKNEVFFFRMYSIEQNNGVAKKGCCYTFRQKRAETS